MYLVSKGYFKVVFDDFRIAPLIFQQINANELHPQFCVGVVLSDLIQRCIEAGLSMTAARRAILQALENSSDHPDAIMLHARAKVLDPTLAQATVYRTMRILEQAGLVEKHDFGNGRARYEEAEKAQHDHLINLSTGEIIEFQDEDLEALKVAIAKRLGFDLKDHRLELYGVPKE